MQLPDLMNDALRLHAMARLAAAGVSVMTLPGGGVRLMNHHGDAVVTHDVLSLKPRVLDRLAA